MGTFRIIETIERDALCWGSPQWWTFQHFCASEYGDPELAMIAKEEADQLPDTYSQEEAKLMADLLGLLSEQDRVIMLMSLQSFSQGQISAALGLTQPSISLKLSRIKRWLSTVYPMRLALQQAGEIIPACWLDRPQRLHCWIMLTRTHAPKECVAKHGGYRTWPVTRATWADIEREGNEAQRAIARLLSTGESRRWSCPRTNDDRKSTLDESVPSVADLLRLSSVL